MLGGDLRSGRGVDLGGDAAEPSGLAEAREARELEADRDKLPSAVAAEPRMASHPLSVRSRSARPRQPLLSAPRAPPRLPPAHRSHARDGPQGPALVAVPARGQAIAGRPASGPTGRVESLRVASRIFSPAALAHANDTTPQASPTRVSLPHTVKRIVARETFEGWVSAELAGIAPRVVRAICHLLRDPVRDPLFAPRDAEALPAATRLWGRVQAHSTLTGSPRRASANDV
jgi:hypothetical protein